jgi:hypothetical protein
LHVVDSLVFVVVANVNRLNSVAHGRQETVPLSRPSEVYKELPFRRAMKEDNVAGSDHSGCPMLGNRLAYDSVANSSRLTTVKKTVFLGYDPSPIVKELHVNGGVCHPSFVAVQP